MKHILLICKVVLVKKKVVKKKVSKRKPNPYALFVKKNFATVQKNNPKWKATDVVKEIAKMWKKK